jgi:CHASE3 domain sensor protein
MIAETLAGISLVKAAVDQIKSVINTANDVGEIAGFVDKLFEGEQQVQQKRNKKSSSSFSISNVARETIDAKLAQEKMDEMRTLIDWRFGHGTWQSIVTERARRIQEAKEVALRERKAKAQKQADVMDTLQILVIVAGFVVLIAIAIVYMAYSAAQAIGLR